MAFGFFHSHKALAQMAENTDCRIIAAGWKPKPSWTSPWSAARVMRGYLLAKPELELFHSNAFA
ncbi:hypothetical protein D9M68_942050 [compost metagenome]